MSKSNKTVEELEALCEELALRIRVMKDKLREVSKALNITINEKYNLKEERKKYT